LNLSNNIRMNVEKNGGKDRKGGFSMKKSKILIVGLIALLMTVGLVLVGCEIGANCPGCGRSESNCKASPGCGYSASTCNCDL